MSEKLSAIIKSSMDLIRFFFQSFQRFSFKLLLMAFLSDYLIFKRILIDVRVVTGKKLIIVWMQSWILLEFCWNWIKFDSIGLNWIAMNWNRFFCVWKVGSKTNQIEKKKRRHIIWRIELESVIYFRHFSQHTISSQFTSFGPTAAAAHT